MELISGRVLSRVGVDVCNDITSFSLIFCIGFSENNSREAMP